MPLSVDLNYMWWNGWQPRLWGGGGVIGIIILPALKLKLIMVIPMSFRVVCPSQDTNNGPQLPTLQLPLKPWPDPPLVLQVLLDVHPVPPPVLQVCLAVYPVSRPVLQVSLDVYPVSCPVVEKMENGKPCFGLKVGYNIIFIYISFPTS